MYKVIRNFIDLKDSNYEYKVGDEFPRVGAEVSEGRINELSGSRNKLGTPLIAEIEGVEAEDVKGKLDLSEMTRAELMKYAKEKGIKLNLSMTKEAMLEKIEG